MGKEKIEAARVNQSEQTIYSRCQCSTKCRAKTVRVPRVTYESVKSISG